MKFTLLIVTALTIISLPLYSKGDDTDWKAKQGFLDFSKWDFEKDGVKTIKGDWEVYWKQLLKPKDFKVKGKAKLTGFGEYERWKGTKVGETELEEFGYATYRIRVWIKDPYLKYALKIPEPLSSLTIFINGVQLGKSGIVGTSRESSIPTGAITFLDFIPNSNELEIILHVSNYNYRDRGQSRSITIGNKDDIYDARLTHISIDTFIIGSIIIMGLYHLGMYSIRRKKVSPLLFGLFCTFVGARTLATGKGDILHVLFHNVPFRVEKILEFLGFMIGIACFTHLTHDLCEKNSKRWQYVYYWPICILFTLALFVVPVRHIPPLIKVFHPISLTAILSAFIVLGKGIKHKTEGTYLFLIGLILVAGSAVNDILLARRVVNSIPLSHFGLFLYIFIQAILIFKNFAKAFRQVEVSEKQIKKMNLELVEKEKARTLFFHNTSHELRTPLNGILGFVELLRRERYGKITPQTKAQLIKVEDLANALKNQVNTILDIAKSKKGELALTNSKVCLNEIVEEARVLSEGLILASEGLGFEVKTSWNEGDNPEYINDREKILTIVRNLLGNAFKFKDPARDNKVTMELKHSDDGIEIVVSDTGIGIPKSEHGKVFREFEQVESDTNRSYEGTGLGLSMVKSIVELMTGVITLSSEEGIGTTFHVKLPTQEDIHITKAAMDQQKEDDLKRLEEVDGEVHVSDEAPEESESTGEVFDQSFLADKPYKILLVDDNEINLEVIGEVLKSNGYPIEKANGGKLALEMLGQEKPDLMILDLMMPEVSGEDVLKAVREDDDLKDLPVILLTARASQEDRILGLNLGADDYLAKPIITDEILLRVKNILSRIDLARERSQMNVMERQNEIISSLLEIGAEMQLIDNLDEFLVNVLSKLDELFTNRSFAMMIVGPREDIIANIACVEVTPDEKKLIIDNQPYVVHNKSNAFDQTRKKYIEKEVDGRDRIKMAELFGVTEEEGWVMLGGEIQTPGVDKKNVRFYLKLFIRGAEFTIEELDTLKVFLDQVLAASRNKLLAAKLDRMAHTDALTGAYNRAYFMPLLEKQIRFTEESEKMNFSILMCDINGLKQVNDECGHEEGDDLIVQCFKILNDVSRESDIVIRQGGDEFIILCPATNEDAAAKLLDRIREVEKDAHVSYKKKDNGAVLEMDIRMAIGYASSENNPAQEVLKVADQRMYADKEKFYEEKDRYR